MERGNYLFASRTMDIFVERVAAKRTAKGIIKRGSDQADAQQCRAIGRLRFDVEHKEMRLQLGADR